MAEFRKEEMVHRLRDLESRMSRLRTAWGSVAKDIAQTINRAFGDTRAIAQVPEELEPEQYLEVRIGGRDLRIVFRMVDTDSTNTGATAAGDLLGAILFQEMAIGPTGERKPIPIAIDGLLLNEQGDWREQSSPAGKFFLGDALPASILSSLSEYVLKAQPKLTGNDLKPPMSQNVL